MHGKVKITTNGKIAMLRGKIFTKKGEKFIEIDNKIYLLKKV